MLRKGKPAAETECNFGSLEHTSEDRKVYPIWLELLGLLSTGNPQEAFCAG